MSLPATMAVYQQIAMAIGETMEAVCNMQQKEREELIKVLGLEQAIKDAQKDNATTSSVIDVGEIDSDDEVLVNTVVKEDSTNIWVSSDEEGDVEVVSGPSGSAGGGGGSKRKAEDVLDMSGPRGWGECPVCDQMMPLSKLQLHAMACQGIDLNGGSGLEVCELTTHDSFLF